MAKIDVDFGPHTEDETVELLLAAARELPVDRLCDVIAYLETIV